MLSHVGGLHGYTSQFDQHDNSYWSSNTKVSFSIVRVQPNEFEGIWFWLLPCYDFKL